MMDNVSANIGVIASYEEAWDRFLVQSAWFQMVAESGRLRPSGAAGANFFGGAVWGVFRENANCGDPPG